MKLLASALMVARTLSGPRGEVFGARELTHVGPDLGKDTLGGALAHARYRVKQRYRFSLGLQVRFAFLVDPCNGPIQLLNVGEMLGDQEALMGLERAHQRHR
jgi:hypothetical protein